MKLMGHANWWLPKWLDRILPNLDIEGDAACRPPSCTARTPVPVPAVVEPGARARARLRAAGAGGRDAGRLRLRARAHAISPGGRHLRGPRGPDRGDLRGLRPRARAGSAGPQVRRRRGADDTELTSSVWDPYHPVSADRG